MVILEGKTDTVLYDPAVATVLLTRLPVPRLPEHTFTHQARAAWAFPLAGVLVAIPSALVGWVLMVIGVPVIAVAGFVLLCQVVLTGAMHEDGLADTADGLWGGWTPERRLEIMKDSRIGAYGVIALVFGIGLRWIGLSLVLETANIWAVVIAVAALSRCGLAALMTLLPNARQSGLSQSVGRPGLTASVVSLGIGLGLALTTLGTVSLLPIVAAAFASAALAALAKAKIGGQTGDILGASQQVAEIVLLIGLASTMA